MIIGIGIDICEISRMKKACERNGFTARFFSKRENEEFAQRKYPPQSIAAAFAAKEAAAKAFGTGIRGFSMKDIELLHDSLGKPYVVLSGKAKEQMEAIGADRIHVSITHTGNIAAAFIILEGKEIPS